MSKKGKLPGKESQNKAQPKRYPVKKESKPKSESKPKPKSKPRPKRYPIPKNNKVLNKYVSDVVSKFSEYDTEGISKDGKLGRDLLRMLAGQYYAANLNQCSVREMEKHPIFKVSSGNLERWAWEDGWVERRREFQETIRQRVQKVLVSEVVQIQMDQLKDLQVLFDKLLGKVLGAVEKLDMETTSFPALVNAVVKLAELLHDWRLSLGELVAPKMGFEGKETSTQIPVKPDLSFEETRAAAKYLIKLRREQIRQSKKLDFQEDSTENMEAPVKNKPTSKIIEGE